MRETCRECKAKLTAAERKCQISRGPAVTCPRCVRKIWRALLPLGGDR